MSNENVQKITNNERSINVETLIKRKINNVLKAVSELELLANTAKPVLFSKSHVQVDVEELKNIIETIRETLPSELSEAELVVNTVEDIIRNAEVKASKIESEALMRAEKLISENEITTESVTRAEKIVSEAFLQKDAIEADTQEYLIKLFASAEEGLNGMLNSVNQVKSTVIDITKNEKIRYGNQK